MRTAQPPTSADLALFCGIEGLSQLTPEDVRRHAPDLLLAEHAGAAVRARASLWWSDVPAYGDERLGFVGHYAARDAAAGTALLRSCCETLAAHGCTLAVGPLDGSTWRRYRLLTERGSEPPFFLEPDNPDDWPAHFDGAGFAPLARYYSSMDDDNARGSDDQAACIRRCTRDGYRLRPLARDALAAELPRLWMLACEAFRDNLLYSPISREEFDAMYAPLVAQVPPELVRIAEWQGAPVAFCLALPDLLQARRGQRIDTVIVKTLGVVPAHRRAGLGAALAAQVNQCARAAGMHRTIHALMHEDNPSRRLARGLMRDFRGYTLYARRP